MLIGVINKLRSEFNLVVILIIIFIILVPLGTLLHEFGHIIVAEKLGFATDLHFASMSFTNDLKVNLLEVYSDNQIAIDENLPFEGDFLYKEHLKEYNNDVVSILFGGIFQTISFGLVGFIMLMRRKIKKVSFSFIDWVFVFLTFFLSRSVFNMTVSFFNGVVNNTSYFGGDEFRIARILNVFEGTFVLLFGLLSSLILAIVIFYIMPLKYRFIFIFSGVVGSMLGFVIWMIILGPVLLP